MSREQFIQTLLPGALEASRRTGLDPRLILAQAAQETGWGRSAPGNNYFGIKSHGKGGGQTFTTHEVINGKRVKINDSFRRYDSPSDSALGYAEFLQANPRYRNMLSADGLDAQLEALGKSGYATDPNYARSVGAIARGIDIDGAKYTPGMTAQQQPSPVLSPGEPAPPLPPPVNIRDMPIAGPQEQMPQGILAMLGGGGEQQGGGSPLLQALMSGGGQQQQAPEMMQLQPMPQMQMAQQKMPPLSNYLEQFLKSRMV